MMNLLRNALLIFGLLATTHLGYADANRVQPTGEYATIDTALMQETIQRLSSGPTDDRRKVVQEILASPQRYAPPVFYMLSSVLFGEDKKDDAAFWFYAGQLRASFDASRCADVSARQAVEVMNQQFGSPINQYAFKNTAKLEALIPKVIEWDRKTAHAYDHRWINLHGMNAMMSGLDPKKRENPAPLSLPREQWDSIAEKTRQEYLAAFNEVMKEVRKRKS